MQLSAVLDPHTGYWDLRVDGDWLADGAADRPVLDLPDIDTDDVGSARLVLVVLEDDERCVLTALRPANAKGQDRDQIEVRFSGLGEGAEVVDPRLSTEYSGDGLVQRFGVELWIAEEPEGDQRPLRFGGEGDGRARRTRGATAFPMRAHSGEMIGRGIYLLLTS